MSGPKTSRYTITPEQRRILEEQRRIERRKAVATANIKRTKERLFQIGGMFGGEKQIAAELTSRTGNDNGITELLNELEALITPIHPLVVRTNYDDVNSVEGTAAEINSCLAKVEKLTDKIIAISAINTANLRVDIQEAIDEGLKTSFADIKERKTIETFSLRDDAVQKLTQFQKSDILPKTYKEEIVKALNELENIIDERFLKNYIALSVNPLIKKSNQFVLEYKECQEEFDKLYNEYITLCELYYYVAQEYVCSQSSIQILRSEIERIQEAVAADDEQAYISDCLDEVMSEMGYAVLGNREVIKRNGKRFRNELYAYGEGTAVNVTYSSDGKIAMELGGIDASDRAPTMQEAEKLCDSMEQFCDDFEEIEKRLLAKGVMLADRISLLPPNAEYAQIINTTDYAMKTEIKFINEKKQRRPAFKQKAVLRE